MGLRVGIWVGEQHMPPLAQHGIQAPVLALLEHPAAIQDEFAVTRGKELKGPFRSTVDEVLEPDQMTDKPEIARGLNLALVAELGHLAQFGVVAKQKVHAGCRLERAKKPDHSLQKLPNHHAELAEEVRHRKLFLRRQ